jgi:hypothetical protein
VTRQDAPSASPGEGPAPPGEPCEPGPAVPGGPLLPEQSREDTDEGWGDYPQRDDDWLRRDRPPHWADY